MAEYVNVSNLMGGLISQKLATLHELDTVYSYEDALNLAEIIQVKNYNTWATMEAVRR